MRNNVRKALPVESRVAIRTTIILTTPMKLVAKVAAIRLTATILLRNADNNGASYVVAADRHSFPGSLTSKISSVTPSRFCNDRTPPPSP